MDNYLKFAKGAATFMASAGVGAVVKNAVNAGTPENINRIKKITIGIGAVVLSGMAGDFASRYAESKIDEAVDAYNEVKNAVDDIKEQAKD